MVAEWVEVLLRECQSPVHVERRNTAIPSRVRILRARCGGFAIYGAKSYAGEFGTAICAPSHSALSTGRRVVEASARTHCCLPALATQPISETYINLSASRTLIFFSFPLHTYLASWFCDQEGGAKHEPPSIAQRRRGAGPPSFGVVACGIFAGIIFHFGGFLFIEPVATCGLSRKR